MFIFVFCTSPVKLIGKLPDGKIFVKKGYDEEPFEFKIDEGNNNMVLSGLGLPVQLHF